MWKEVKDKGVFDSQPLCNYEEHEIQQVIKVQRQKNQRAVKTFKSNPINIRMQKQVKKDFITPKATRKPPTTVIALEKEARSPMLQSSEDVDNLSKSLINNFNTIGSKIQQRVLKAVSSMLMSDKEMMNHNRQLSEHTFS